MMNFRNLTIPAWTWSFLAAFVVLILTFMVAGGGAKTLTLAFTIAPYLVLVGLGQMLVMSTGAGNIDVSVAKVFSLGGLVSIAVGEATGSWVLGLAAAMAAGFALSCVSLASIIFIRIPPIVATLATSLLASAVSLTLAQGFQGSADPVLKGFLGSAPMGVPAFALVVLLFTIFVQLMLGRTTWGAQTLAFGQARRASEYAGVSATKTLTIVYLTSGVLAALSGALRASFSAPNVELGNDYLLDSIAVVVIGGTLITGGRSEPAGIWGGALFFILLDGLLNLIGWDYAGQNILKGFFVLAVLFLASGVPIIHRRSASANPADLTLPEAADSTASGASFDVQASAERSTVT
ncbi:ABC transporter permease [Mesorhizobium retamae]|uniref:ABC transporter permease n=1 Tax=Mesorhizobium retamae TaxID=2912854 RepID=A0ABS9QD91_9HYPH|nr:ABC transporter permease [Mesorhizobium sp. IRAMC:0171]MCG7505365.1 ABC transporter permease [Mesorhizobium sp. IRAMC:0171]